MVARLLNDKERQGLKKFRFTAHAVERILERYPNHNSELVSLVNNTIDKSPLVYINTDGSVNVGVDEYSYFVFERDKFNRADYVLVTYKVPQEGYEHTSVQQRYELALEGRERYRGGKR